MRGVRDVGGGGGGEAFSGFFAEGLFEAAGVVGGTRHILQSRSLLVLLQSRSLLVLRSIPAEGLGERVRGRVVDEVRL